jgi:hypothetical protein
VLKELGIAGQELKALEDGGAFAAWDIDRFLEKEMGSLEPIFNTHLIPY